MIIRNDDVSPATPPRELMQMYTIIRKHIPSAQIWSCVNLFAKMNIKGSVYPDLPLKEQPMSYFYDVDKAWQGKAIGIGKIVSHGVLHVDHTQLSRDAKEMSIVTSCKFLQADIFVPPFNKYDEEMDDICKSIGVRLVKPSDGWKSLESDTFNPDHKLWFFHSWRYTPKKLEELLCNGLLAQEGVALEA